MNRSKTSCFRGEWLKPNKPLASSRKSHDLRGEVCAFDRTVRSRGFIRATGCIEPSSCTTDMRKRDKTETGRDRNGMKRDGTADRIRKCGSITMADNWDHNPFNSRLTKRPLYRLTPANPPESIASPNWPRPCRKVELSDRVVASIGQNAIRRNRPRTNDCSQSLHPAAHRISQSAIGQSKSDVMFRIIASMSPLTLIKLTERHVTREPEVRQFQYCYVKLKQLTHYSYQL